MMLPNFLLGLWLMLSPLTLAFLNRRIANVLWEDLLLGFGIATFALCRLLSRRREEIVIADWLVTALGFLTLANPFLHRYFTMPIAAWNDVTVGALFFF